MTDLLHSVHDGRILRLTLNRPEKRNALDAALCRALVDALEDADGDPSTGAILLAANGRTFCAGMDISEIERAEIERAEIERDAPTHANAHATAEINAIHERLFTLGARLTKPIVAAVHGAALGGGTGLVANCHIVVAAPEATFGLTEIRLGLWPFLIYRAVAAALGERRTVELSLTGRIFGATEARDTALVHEIAADARARALEIARSVADFSPVAIQSGLAFIQKVRGLDLARSGEIAQTVRNQIFAGADFREGMRAFREKRAPRWPSIAGADS